MHYRISITTTSTGGAKWLKDYLRALEGQYGRQFVEDLDDKGVAELRSEDQDGAVAVSRYELHTIE